MNAADCPYGYSKRRSTVKRIHLLLCYLLFWTAFWVTTGAANASNEIIRDPIGLVAIDAQDSDLIEIFQELSDKYAVEISGLENRESEKFTFSFKADTLETLLRRMLRYLGVKNFAIQFDDARLTRVMVLPESVSDLPISENLQTDRRNPPASISVAQIMSVVEFSQAQSLDLTAGDIIIEYDGVRISSAQQLVEEVAKKAENSQVDMIVIREKNAMRLILAGGIIGVRIRTKNISYEEIDVVY
jgi:membrane-associated protease RseP (regulator of RpoE activity)